MKTMREILKDHKLSQAEFGEKYRINRDLLSRMKSKNYLGVIKKNGLIVKTPTGRTRTYGSVSKEDLLPDICKLPATAIEHEWMAIR